MDSDFIECLQRFNLTEEEGEAITVQSEHSEKILGMLFQSHWSFQHDKTHQPLGGKKIF